MTSDRSLERAARSWLEEGPTQAPDRAVDAALARIQSISQERDLVPWRMPTMNPIARLAAVAVLAMLAVGGVLYVAGGGPSGPIPTPAPTATPAPTPTPTAAAARPSPSPFSGACTLLTSEEAETTVPALTGGGARPAEVEISGNSVCVFSNAGQEVLVRLTWVRTGGTAVFDAAAATTGVEVVPALGDAAVFDPATSQLYVRRGDRCLIILANNRSKEQATAFANVAVPRM